MSDQTVGRTCPACGSDQRPQARFCDQCAAPLSATATRRPFPANVPPALLPDAPPPQRVLRLVERRPAWGEAERAPAYQPPAGVIPAGTWGVAGDYALSVKRALRGVADNGAPSVAIEVEYRSRGARSLPCSRFQWHLCDALGRHYGVELDAGALLGERGRQLHDEQIAPDGALRVWVAFACPLDVPVSHVRFRAGRRDEEHLALALPGMEYRDCSVR